MIVNLNRFITTALYVGLLQFLSISFKVIQSFKSCMQEEEKGKNQRYKKIKSTDKNGEENDILCSSHSKNVP